MGYKKPPTIESALQDLSTSFPDTCGVFHLNHATYDNNTVSAVRIQAGPRSMTPVLFTGGVHARELVPPDALLSFCSKLLSAYDSGSDITYLDFTDVHGITYDEYTVDKSIVAKVLENFSLFVVPCANPDGRNFVLSGSSQTNMQWRKNRRPDPTCAGVDLNRNFPFAWDSDVYYSSSPSVISTVNGSKSKCSRNFRGYTQAPAPNTSIEPETRNLIDLAAEQSIQYLVDVHMFGRYVLYPWGMDTDQTTLPDQNFANTAFDHKRDGPDFTAYSEYLPGPLLSTLRELADSMVAEISHSAGSNPTAVARCLYSAEQSASLGATTGAFDDYTFGQQFLNPNSSELAKVCAFTLECGNAGPKGGDNDSGFAPDYATQYPKVEREVHAALFGLLNAL